MHHARGFFVASKESGTSGRYAPLWASDDPRPSLLKSHGFAGDPWLFASTVTPSSAHAPCARRRGTENGQATGKSRTTNLFLWGELQPCLLTCTTTSTNTSPHVFN